MRLNRFRFSCLSFDSRNAVKLSYLTYANFLVVGIRNLILSRLLGAEVYAVNTLSTQILLLLAFIDLGAVLSLQRDLPRYSKSPAKWNLILCRVRKTTFYAYGVAWVMLTILAVTLVSTGNRHWLLAVTAAFIIFPLQNTVTFRVAAYTAMGMQSRAARMIFYSSLINFFLTFTFYRELGSFVIVCGPAVGFLGAITIDSRQPHLFELKFREIWHSKVRDIAKADLKIRLTIMWTYLLAIIMVNCDFYFASSALHIADAGRFGLAMNLVAFLPLASILLSNQMSPLMNASNASSVSEVVVRYMQMSRTLLREVNGSFVVIVSTCFTFIVKLFLPEYSKAIPIAWILAFGTYFYLSTFYSSTYAISQDSQRKILVVQIQSLFVQLMAFVVLSRVFGASLIIIGISSLMKYIYYSFTHAKALQDISGGQLREPLLNSLKICLRATTIILALISVLLNHFEILPILSAFEIFRFFQRVPSRWQSWTAASEELRVTLDRNSIE